MDQINLSELTRQNAKRYRVEEEIIQDRKLHKFIEKVTAKCKRRECVVSEYDPLACERLRKKVSYCDS